MTDNKKQEQKNEVPMEDFFFNPWKLLKLDVQKQKECTTFNKYRKICFIESNLNIMNQT